MKIKLLFFDEQPNFGDMLNLYIPKLFGVDVEKGGPYKSDAVFIGSVMSSLLSRRRFSLRKYLYRPVKIWGAGFIEPEDDKKYLRRRVQVFALRGKFSLERMRKYTGEVLDNVALGDPGLLASMLVDTSKINKKYKLGIITHFVDAESPHLKKIDVENSILIDILSDPVSFMEQVAQCETVISSAMHGLIAADSIGVPNVRMILSDKIIGGGYKFADYYSAFDIDSHKKIDLRQLDIFDDAESIKKNYKIRSEKVAKLRDALIGCFPYKETKK